MFGQPITRISRMTLTQIDRSEGHTVLRVTDDDITIPAPFDAILIAHLDELPHQTTSAHRDNTWLFPGARPGQHIHQGAIMNRLRDSGIDLRAAKNSTLRALVLEIPAAIVADSLGHSYQVTEKHRRSSGAAFVDYVQRRT